jgi:hypothetical protein
MANKYAAHRHQPMQLAGTRARPGFRLWWSRRETPPPKNGLDHVSEPTHRYATGALNSLLCVHVAGKGFSIALPQRIYAEVNQGKGSGISRRVRRHRCAHAGFLAGRRKTPPAAISLPATWSGSISTSWPILCRSTQAKKSVTCRCGRSSHQMRVKLAVPTTIWRISSYLRAEYLLERVTSGGIHA